MPVDWGSIPDWLAGTGAVIALLWARRAAHAATRTDQRQGEQLAAYEQDRRRQQADGLAVWMDFERVDSGGDDSDEWQWYFKIRNASDLPIYELRAWAHMFDVSGERKLAFAWFRILPPASNTLRVLAFEGTLGRLGADLYGEPLRLVNLAFRDASGACWHRRESTLSELSVQEYDEVVNKVDVVARRKSDQDPSA